MTTSEHALLPRPVRDSQSEMVEVVLPNDANPLGNLLGGRLMHLIDVAGALACHRHARSFVVTASTDHLDFLAPVHVGDLLVLRSSVNRAFHTSMEVGVKVWVENYIAVTKRHVSSAYLTFVAVDRRGIFSRAGRNKQNIFSNQIYIRRFSLEHLFQLHRNFYRIALVVFADYLRAIEGRNMRGAAGERHRLHH